MRTESEKQKIKTPDFSDMQIISELKKSEKPTAVALGFFDGIHLGHQAVIKSAVEYAKSHNLVPTVFTMLQSPRSVLFGEKVEAIITRQNKLEILAGLGVKQAYVIDFLQIRDITAQDFIRDILKNCFNAEFAVCGFNYHFGKSALGNKEVLQKLCSEYNIASSAQTQICYENLPVSSSRIRNCIRQGDMPSVNAMLGRPYHISSPVIHGRQLGRQWGTPTMNQRFPKGLVLPMFGVYASAVKIDGKEYCGVTNVGIKPTVGSDEVLSETWMPDYQGQELYGETIDVCLTEKLRGEKKFGSIEELKAEILLNGQQAKEIFQRKRGF